MAKSDYKNKKYKEIDYIENKIKEYDKISDIPTDLLVDKNTGFAYTIAESFKKNLKTNQLRKFFGAVRKIESKNEWKDMEREFHLLKPRMASSTGRGKIPKKFFDVMYVAMTKVDVGTPDEKKENFKIFVEFFEAIVAYHKYLGGD